MEILLEASVRAVLVAAGVGLSLKVFRLTSAAAAHRLWVAVVGCMLALPLIVGWGPTMPVRVLPSAFAEPPASPSPIIASRPDASAPVTLPAPALPRVAVKNIAMAVYALGVIVCLVQLAAALRRTRRLAQDARLVNGRLAHAACITPVTVGLFAPQVILPIEWPRWSESQLAAVLAHEGDHIRRRDSLVTCVALLNRAIFWFHPLAWWLPRTLTVLAEQACDATVLRQGHNAHAYAASLITFSRSVAAVGRRCSPLEMAMPGSHLAERIRQVLEGAPLRRDPPVRRASAVAVGGVLAAVVMAATPVTTQSGTPAPSRFPGPDERFEVASVKPNTSGRPQWDFDDPPGRIVGTNVVLRDLIRFAYFIYGGDWELRIAGPEWIKTARFDVDAKAPDDTLEVTRKMSMLRDLLADRFALKVHYEYRQHPIYALVLARTDGRLGPQLARSSMDCAAMSAARQAARAAGTPLPFPPDPATRPICGQRGRPGQSSAGALTMEQFALHITAYAGRQVVDKTGLTGPFDWDLHWTPVQPSLDGEPPALPSGPSIFTALEEQLGLKLEPERGPVEVVVIDHVEMPTPN